MTNSWLVPVICLAIAAVIMKIAGHAAIETKRQLDDHGIGDPVVNALAWFDRVTSFRRRA